MLIVVTQRKKKMTENISYRAFLPPEEEEEEGGSVWCVFDIGGSTSGNHIMSFHNSRAKGQRTLLRSHYRDSSRQCQVGKKKSSLSCLHYMWGVIG